MFFRSAALLICLCLLAGCGARTVAVIDDKGFAEMSRRMPEEMRARKLLTKDGDYLSRLDFESRPYGDILFATLSPDFLFDDTGGHVYFGETFRATRTPTSRVSLRENGFTLRHPTQTVTLSMLGVLDWDDDGTDEWLAACRVEPLRGSRVRTYYILIPPPARAGQPLKASVAALYECYGLACTMYVNKALALHGEGNDPATPATPVQDSVPGLQQVTEPPSARKADGEAALEEHSL
ncbi:hypothetical protein [uncultured Desulfovibrio sp.]|uniref:Lipoprotein n=1 Tax=Candidatus Desulfovibrio intestinavium TaxID=2838534 RepID=A0A9D2HPU1_9BACT|nr:hypothetical protein [uncultured Desulfovibrio sp.]HJA80092.1 hypothetical protein [Candidatus Desulfovibrio intestinavium]